MNKADNSIISIKDNKETSKKAVIISILTLSIICTTFALTITIAHAMTGGILWVNDGTGWVAVDKQFDVLPGVTYSIKVCNIPTILGNQIFIKVSNEDGWTRSVSVSG